MKILITNADKSDLQKILELQYLAYQSEARLVNDFSIPPLTQTIGGITEDFNNGIMLKANHLGDIIGSVRGRCSNENRTLYIGRLIVHPLHQNRGIGTGLLLAIEQSYPNMRYELFTSDRSEKNLYLYEKNGYKEFKREPLNGHASLVFLEKLH